MDLDVYEEIVQRVVRLEGLNAREGFYGFGYTPPAHVIRPDPATRLNAREGFYGFGFTAG